MNSSIIRSDLDRCYRYNEYNEAMDYANKNINVEGMREQIDKLKNINQIYVQDIKSIIEPERESENNKYLQWENWNKVKIICIRIIAALFGVTVISFVLGACLWSGFKTLGILGIILMILSIPVLITAKAAEFICAGIYKKCIDKLMDKINARNSMFGADAKRSYAEMDALYLQSLRPEHRETVLMHREQIEHQKEMERLERERNRKVEEQLKEAKRMRVAQEHLLEIEKEREKRYKGY